MPSTTTIRVTDNLGAFLFEAAEFLEIGPSPGLHYVLSCGQVGALTVTLPPEYNAYILGADHKPMKDVRIHVMRSVNGGAAKREGDSCFLARKWDISDDFTVVTALHANHLFWRRHVLYTWINASSEQGPEDDMIKDTFTHNNITDGFFTPAREGGTTQFDLSSYLTIEANLGLAPSSFKRMGWMNVGDMIVEMASDATQSGTYVTAEIVCPTEPTLELRTYVGQRGIDKRASTGSGIVFSERNGNLANALLTIDAIEEVTHALAGGPMRDWGGTIQYAEDATRMGGSPFGRIERFVDSTSDDNNELLNDATAAVRGGRPIISVTAELQEIDTCVRGVHFDYGDRVTVDARGIQYDMRLDVLEVSLQGGVETTRVSFYANE